MSRITVRGILRIPKREISEIIFDHATEELVITLQGTDEVNPLMEALLGLEGRHDHDELPKGFWKKGASPKQYEHREYKKSFSIPGKKYRKYRRLSPVERRMASEEYSKLPEDKHGRKLKGTVTALSHKWGVSRETLRKFWKFYGQTGG